MNDLLLFFALPIAIIIISIAMQKIFKCPFLVSGIVFSVFLVVTFVIGNVELLIPTIIYTILSFTVSVIVSLIDKFIKNFCCDKKDIVDVCGNKEIKSGNCKKDLLKINSSYGNPNKENLLTISSECCNRNEDLLEINSNNFNNNDCCDRIINPDEIIAKIKIIPNRSINYGIGCNCRRNRR